MDENFGQAYIDEYDDWRSRYNESIYGDKEDCEIIQDMLLLIDLDVDIKDILSWSDEDRASVEKWAGKMILKANDNNVHVPDRPTVLQQ